MHEQKPRPTAWFAVIVLMAAAAGVNASYFALTFPDEVEYWSLATNLARVGTFSYDGVTPSAFRPPLIAWILAPFAALGWPMAVVRIFFILFFAATGALAGVFLSRVFSTTALAPAFGTAFVLSHPLYFFSAGNLYPQQVLTPLLIAALGLASMRPQSAAAASMRSVLVGLIAGASLLASAPAIFSLLPVLAVLAWEDWSALRRREFTRAWRAAIAATVLVLCVLPLVHRNARNVHPGIFLTLNSGVNLLVGNSPSTTSTSGVDVDISEHRAAAAGESEFDQNRRFTRAAVANIGREPARYAHLYFRKLAAGFGNAVETVTHGYSQRATWAMRGYMALVWIGVGVFLMTLLRRRELFGGVDPSAAASFRTFALLALAAYLLSLAGYAVFFTRLRFRIPTDVALAFIGAVGWCLAWNNFTRRRRGGHV